MGCKGGVRWRWQGCSEGASAASWCPVHAASCHTALSHCGPFCCRGLHAFQCPPASSSLKTYPPQPPTQTLMLKPIHADGKLCAVWRCLLLADHLKQPSLAEGELLGTLRRLRGSCGRWALVMLRGGHFAAAIFQMRDTSARSKGHVQASRGVQAYEDTMLPVRMGGAVLCFGRCQLARVSGVARAMEGL